jgi:hypothetical protein
VGAIVIGATLCALGCVTTLGKSATVDAGFRTQPPIESPKRILSKRDFDHVISAGLSRQETVRYLKNIKIQDYGIQDPNTNWSYASVGGAGSRYSVYYLTYHKEYFILLLEDVADKYVDFIDVVTGMMPSTEYEIGMGPVEINHDRVDGRVVVIFNKKWKENYSDDIVAAFRPNLETKQIDVFDYKYIRIFREE